jgi:ribonucleoside-diphosphate reductase alpha chain
MDHGLLEDARAKTACSESGRLLNAHSENARSENMRSENARHVLEARYLRRDARGRVIETPGQLVERVAGAVAEGERVLGSGAEIARWRDEFHRLLAAFDFLPNSPTLMNAGTPLGQLSACFVLPVDDTMESIFEALKQMALLQRTGGGTGFSFSHLRPRGDLLTSTGGQASGPVSFMRIFDCATEHVKHGGRRRGANMGVLRVDHPDILEFVTAKREEGSLRNFNLSVGVTDAFMDAARRRQSYDLLHPSTRQAVTKLDAALVLRAIAEAAWQSGDPGLLFLDAIDRGNPTPWLDAIEATNPCGEVPLLPYESCTLGSINLAHMLTHRAGGAEVDWPKLRRTIHTAIRFLDDVIEINRFSIPHVGRATRATRKVGLGLMGFAELLIELDLSYHSDEAVALAKRLMAFIDEEAFAASRCLADERGVFPAWPASVYPQRDARIRNATRTAIAPTGTISIIAGTSASIEPVFALAYRRSHVLGDSALQEVNPLLEAHLRRHGLDAQDIITQVIAEGTLQGVRSVPEHLKHLFVTALDIPPERHLQVQAAFQRHVDNSVSKTVNLPRTACVDDVAGVYRRAWELGLKGVTIYRYGSKHTQVLELGAGEEPFQYDHASRCDPAECRV